MLAFTDCLFVAGSFSNRATIALLAQPAHLALGDEARPHGLNRIIDRSG